MLKLINALTDFFVLRAAPGSGAQECSGTITVDEALKAEEARFKAQMSGNGAAMNKLFGRFKYFMARPTGCSCCSSPCSPTG